MLSAFLSPHQALATVLIDECKQACTCQEGGEAACVEYTCGDNSICDTGNVCKCKKGFEMDDDKQCKGQ